MKEIKKRVLIDTYFKVLFFIGLLCFATAIERHIQGVNAEPDSIWDWLKAIGTSVAAIAGAFVSGPIGIIVGLFGGLAAIAEIRDAVLAPEKAREFYTARDFYITIGLLFATWAFVRGAWKKRTATHLIEGGHD